jgi:superfamily II DNA/RNA helicase
MGGKMCCLLFVVCCLFVVYQCIVYCSVPIKDHKDTLKNNTPHIIIGTPGRLLALVKSGDMKLDHVKQFVLDECDRMVMCVCVALFL